MSRGNDQIATEGAPTPAGDGQRFLTDTRIEELGTLIAPLISDGVSWIERRKEDVQILDDTALRRQISVDFSLRSAVKPLLQGGNNAHDPLYCAPVFVLPKSPSNLRSFDLCDEGGSSLSLISREDNAKISGEALIALVMKHSGRDDLPSDLKRELRRVAEWEPERAEPIAAKLKDSEGPWGDELKSLRGDPRLVGWLETLAHSSIVVVFFRSSGPRRKLVKLTFEEPITAKQRRLTRLGWASYRVLIDSPRIEARTFHFEAEAPSGLRISKAQLTDSERDDPITETGFMKRVHLYRQSAQRAGAGTAVLLLDVAGPGFVSGAMLASILTVGALLGCALSAESIAANPTSAPALLLVLPGLIASYVARPDQHALTTRLLSFARGLLLGIALCAYTAAARVALAGPKPEGDAALSAETGDLETWLWLLMALSSILFLGLVVTWIRGTGALRNVGGQSRFSCSEGLDLPPSRLEGEMGRVGSDCPLPHNYTALEMMNQGAITLTRSAWHGEWVLSLEIEEIAGSCLISATLDYVNMLPLGFALPLVRRREATRLVSYMDELADWAKAKSEA
jgi:hypothetical protein